MSVQKPSSTKPDPAAARTRVKLSGKDSLSDVAKRVYRDERVLPLLMDLNPGVPAKGPPPAGTVITIPAREEAQRFAAKMGFALGFDPSKTTGTKAKKRWAKLQAGAQKPDAAVMPDELARALLAQDHAPEECARRLLTLVKQPDLDAFVAAAHDDEGLAAVAGHVEALRLRAAARAVLVPLCDVLEATGRPKGRRRLLEVGAVEPGEVAEVLDAFLVVPALKADLLKRATVAVPLLKEADEIAQLDLHLQEVRLAGERPAVLRQLVDAAALGVELVDGERTAGLGVKPQLDALDKHVTQLAALLRKLLDAVERAPTAALRALVDADARADVAKPWPVAIALHAKTRERIARVHAGRRAEGIASLAAPGVVAPPAPDAKMPRPADVAGPTMSAAELAAHAAHNARVADEHDGVPERLSPTVIALFDRLRPSPPDHGPEAQVRQRRKSRFEKAVLTTKGSAGDAAAIRALVEELLELARSSSDEGVARRAKRLSPAVRGAALELAAGAIGSIPALLREASDVARALLVVAVALDVELGPTLAKPAGREAALKLLHRHATRVVTLATQTYVGAAAK